MSETIETGAPTPSAADRDGDHDETAIDNTIDNNTIDNANSNNDTISTGAITTASNRARGGMVPPDSALPDVLPTDRLNVRGMPSGALRDELRRIPNARNVVTVAGALAQSFGVVIAAAVFNTWWSYLLAFVLMTRGHVCLNILGHEAAHRLLFSNRRANDWTGRAVGYSSFMAVMAYRRAHFAHHRDELGPDEPDLSLYAGYPIGRDSMRRKLVRDLFGISAYKNFKVLFGAARRRKSEALMILSLHAVLLGTAIAFGRPLAYVVWVLSWSSLWRVSNRFRSVAEHGGMERSRDRRRTTHVIRQSLWARYWMVPYHTGWHLAHHADMGVPWTNLPRLHDELVASGWVTPEIEYPSYTAFWKAAASGAAGTGTERSQGSSFLAFENN